MSEKSLISAAERLNRFFRIDMQNGGMVSILTEISFDTLVKAIRAAGGRQ